jgi:hypothetical protein
VCLVVLAAGEAATAPRASSHTSPWIFAWAPCIERPTMASRFVWLWPAGGAAPPWRACLLGTPGRPPPHDSHPTGKGWWGRRPWTVATGQWGWDNGGIVARLDKAPAMCSLFILLWVQMSFHVYFMCWRGTKVSFPWRNVTEC